MVVGAARFALPCLFLVVLSWPSQAGLHEVGPMPPGDVRTAELALLDLSTVDVDAGLDLGEEEIMLTRATREGDTWCLHLLEGAPLQPDGPAQSICLRDPLAPERTPGLVAGWDSGGTNPAVDADRRADAVRVTAAVAFTYDCAQMGRQLASVNGDNVQAYSPVELFAGSLANGALGYATSLDRLPAVFEVVVEDGDGEVTSSRTTLPGMGHVIAYSLFMQQEQLRGHSDLCA